jgi:hypothetical protein
MPFAGARQFLSSQCFEVLDQARPAREAVLARDRELRVRQLERA